jgi:hypothetical protein
MYALSACSDVVHYSPAVIDRHLVCSLGNVWCALAHYQPEAYCADAVCRGIPQTAHSRLTILISPCYLLLDERIIAQSISHLRFGSLRSLGQLGDRKSSPKLTWIYSFITQLIKLALLPVHLKSFILSFKPKNFIAYLLFHWKNSSVQRYSSASCMLCWYLFP